MMIFQSRKFGQFAPWVIVATYIAIICLGSSFHEPWRDEAQAWLLVRDLSFLDLIKQMSAEGTPALWHILVFPFAKLGLPYAAMFVLHAIIGILAVTVFVFRAPFSRLIKTLFVFSYLMACEYSIIARNYSITVLLLWLIASYYPQRFRKPLAYSVFIFFLFNTNMHSFGIAAVLCLLYIWESWQTEDVKALPMTVMASGGLTALFQLRPRGAWSEIPIFRVPFDFNNLRIPFAQALFPNLGTSDFLCAISLAIVLLFAMDLMTRKPTLVVLLLISYGWLFYIFCFVHEGGIRHHGFIFIFLMFAYWLAAHDSFRPSIWARIGMLSLTCVLGISCWSSFEFYQKELSSPFSGAKEIVDYIKKNNYASYVIAAYPAPHATSLVPYLGQTQFWFIDYEDRGQRNTFVDWSAWRPFKIDDPSDLVQKIRQKYPDTTKVLLLVANVDSVPKARGSELELLIQNDKTEVFGGDRDEVFQLYKIVNKVSD